MIKKENIQDTLMLMGVTPNYKGFSYIVEGVLYIDAHQGTYNIGDLYDTVAQECRTSYACVERSIRYALQCARQQTPASERVERYIGLEHASNSRSLSRLHLMLAREDGKGESR